MSAIFKYLYDTSSTFLYSTMEGSSETAATVYDYSRYSPSVNDVMSVKSFMFELFNLPIELIDSIIDTAEYWPHSTTITSDGTTIRAQRDRENQFILRTYPLGFDPAEDNQPLEMLPEYKESYKSMEPQPWPKLRDYPTDATEHVFKTWEKMSKPRGEHPCRRIVFTIKSKDQGWGGGRRRGGAANYNDSFTWFDYGLERVSAVTERALLEAWEVAPFPQFRLNTDSQDPQSESSSELPRASKPSLVCSLRTILPETVAGDGPDLAEHNHRGKNKDEKEEDGDQPPPPTPPEREPETNYHFHHELNPSAFALQKNLTANSTFKEHTITWSSEDNINPEAAEAIELEKVGRGRETGTGKIVREMEVGDVLTVWAKARYGGWVNYVNEVKIDVYWAV